jgi:AraC-like DNA-binding protein
VIRRDLYLASIGYFRRKRTHVKARFNFPAIALIVRGKGTYRAGNGPCTVVSPGMVIGVYPGPVFDYGPDDDWEEHYIGFDGPNAARLVESGLIPTGGIPLRLPEVTFAVALFQEAARLYQRDAMGDVDRACLVGQQLLVDLHAAAAGAPSPSDPIEAILATCRQRLQEPLDFQALARRHDISYSSVRQQIRARTGLAPAKYLARLRCEAASVLLATTTLPVKEIARRVGVPDPFSFSRAFRRTIGTAPERYRASQRVYG